MANDELDSVLGLCIVYDCCCVCVVFVLRVWAMAFSLVQIYKNSKTL